MTNELNPKIVSLSLATVSGIFYILCAIIIAITPQIALDFSKHMFHGIDITQIARTSIPIGSTVIGFIEIIILSLIAGWLFAVVYNYLLVRIK